MALSEGGKLWTHGKRMKVKIYERKEGRKEGKGEDSNGK
jgi:hypothetical protein